MFDIKEDPWFVKFCIQFSVSGLYFTFKNKQTKRYIVRWGWELISNCSPLWFTCTFTSRLDHFFFLQSSIGCAHFPPTVMFRILSSTFCTILASSEMQVFASRRRKGKRWPGQKVLVDLHISKNSGVTSLLISTWYSTQALIQCMTPSCYPQVM